MEYKSASKYFNLAYLLVLVFFLIFSFLQIKIIILSYFIIIASFSLLIIKLIYWNSIKKELKNISDFDRQKYTLYRFVFCIFTYITPAFFLIQEPYLIVSNYISAITFTIVTLLVIIGIFIEKLLFNMEEKS